MEAPCFHLSLQTDLSSACAACEACRKQASRDASSPARKSRTTLSVYRLSTAVPHCCSSTTGRAKRMNPLAMPSPSRAHSCRLHLRRCARSLQRTSMSGQSLGHERAPSAYERCPHGYLRAISPCSALYPCRVATALVMTVVRSPADAGRTSGRAVPRSTGRSVLGQCTVDGCGVWDGSPPGGRSSPVMTWGRRPVRRGRARRGRPVARRPG